MKNLLILAFLALPLMAKELPIEAASASAANAFLASLTADQKSIAALTFADDERENFRYTPRKRAGLPLKEMTEIQRSAAMALLDTTLSEKGKLKTTQIISLEGILAEIEQDPERRDVGKYYVSIFGTPGDAKGWGWRFEGHHLSLNITFSKGEVISVTPSFMGTNPAEVREGAQKGLRILADEEDLARTLINTLLAAGKSAAVFSKKPLNEILTGESRRVTALKPVGISTTEMSPAQREALLTIIAQYTGRYRAEIAAADMAKIEKAGIDQIRFGWAGGTQPGEAYYYRIQGPTFLMESCNVQNQANHIHAIWRDFTGDFGRDVLKEHLTHDH